MKKLITMLFAFVAVMFWAGLAYAGDGDGGGWFGSLVGAVSGGVGGGIIGGVLGLGKKFMADRHEAKMVKEQRLEQAEERAHDLALAEKEIERDMKAAESKLTQAVFEADSAALSVASTSQDKEITSLGSTLDGAYKWVKSLAALLFTFTTVAGKTVRIVLTLALVYQTFDMFDQLDTALGGLESLTVVDRTEIFKKIVNSILSLTGIAVGFWFVARPEKSNRS